MPTSCSVQSCTNNKKKNPNLHFHRFPDEKDTCDRWIQACRREDKINITSGRICSEHFLPSDYQRDLKSELLGLPIAKSGPQLKKDAVPSQNLPTPSCVSQSMSTPKLSQRTERMELKRKKTEHHEIVEAALSTPPAEISPNVQDEIPALHDNTTSLQNNAPVSQGNISESDPAQELLLLQIKYNELQKNYQILQNSFRESKKTIRALRKSVTKLQKQAKKARDVEIERKKVKKMTAAFLKEKKRWQNENKIKEDFYEGGSKIFTENQIKLISGTQTRVRWTGEEISQGFTLRFLGQKNYHFLRKELHYPFPAISTLQTWAQAIELKNGFIEGVLHVMGRIGATLDPFEKLTVLLFDEMKVQELYEYDVKRDEVIGPSKQMQVIMARGLTAKWKQVIYIDFDQKMTKKILTTAATLLNSIGYHVVACVSDMGGGNISLMNELRVNKENPTFHLDGYDREIVYFPDAPHLLKLIRNWLIDYGFSLDEKIISIEPIRELIQLSTRTEIRAAHKLTEEHLPKKGSFSRQNVRKASEVLSNTTAKALKYFEGKNKLKSDHCESTADFVAVVDKWFDLVNVRYVDRGIFTKPYKKPYGMALEEQNVILDTMAETMEKLRINNSKTAALQIFQKAVIQQTRALKALFNNLHSEGIKYLIPIKTNQDALENFFMQQRSHCGSNSSPTPLQAKRNARFIFLGKNPGAITKNKNALSNEDGTGEEFILVRALAPNRNKSDQDTENDVVEAEAESVSEEEPENDVPILEDDYGHEYEEVVEEEGPADILQELSTCEPEQASESSDGDTSSTETASVNRISEKYDNTKEEGHEWACGWIALKYKSTHPHLHVPRNRKSTVTIEHQYTNDPPPRTFVEFVSDGGLTVPTQEFLSIGVKLDKLFNDVNGDDFLRETGILTKLCKEADTLLSDEEKTVVPQKVIRRYLKLRLLIRVRHKNLHLKQRKMKQRLKDLEKLRKVAT